MSKPLNILSIAIMLMTGCEDEKSLPYKDLNWIIYSEKGVCTLNDEITDKIYTQKLPHIIDEHVNYIPPSYCTEGSAGIDALHFYEDNNYLILYYDYPFDPALVGPDSSNFPDTIDFSYYTIIHYEEK